MLFLLPLITLISSPQQISPSVDVLKVDPLLLVEAREVWDIIGRRDNPVWPGWDARKTPILIYLPGKQDLLVNHPAPPTGFHRYSGALRSSIGGISVKDGPTIFDLDGQNTSTSVNGVETLVVADTLSSRRQWIESAADSIVKNPSGAPQMIANGLTPEPFDSMVMFAHEAFHVYQRQKAPDKSGVESSLVRYPSLSVENNLGYSVEADRLVEALHATSDRELRESALRWLAVRNWRRSHLSQEAIDYENGTEFSEGLAKYVEYKTLECLQGRKPAPEMWLVQNFRGYGDLSPERERLLRQARGFMNGESVVNNDLYGASSIRFRLYFSGMAIAALLDKLGAHWHDLIFQKGTTLTGLAEKAIHATPEELRSALATVTASSEYGAARAKKEKLASDGDVYVRDQIKEFNSAPGECVIDYSELAEKDLSIVYTPFGILRIDDNRCFYRLIPIRGKVGGVSFEEEIAKPILIDRQLKQIRIPLTASLEPSDLSKQLNVSDVSRVAINGQDLNLGGLKLKSIKGQLRLQGRELVIKLNRLTL